MRRSGWVIWVLGASACVTAPVAPDSGQPRMQAALSALADARAEAEAALPNKGGHRERALGWIDQASAAVNAGMQYAAAHAAEGVAEGPAGPEPVNEAVPGGEGQPHMSRAIVQLREARRQLWEARRDKGGYRVQALQHIQRAIDELREGIRFANGNG